MQTYWLVQWRLSYSLSSSSANEWHTLVGCLDCGADEEYHARDRANIAAAHERRKGFEAQIVRVTETRDVEV